MRHRIERKRATVLTLVEWLRNISDTKSFTINQRIKLFIHRVTKVQRAWRRAALVYRAQIQVTRMHMPCTCHAPCHTHANAHAIHTPMHTCQCTCQCTRQCTCQCTYQCACHMPQVVLVWWGACDYKNRVSALPCARRLQLYAPRLQPYAPMLQPYCPGCSSRT